MSVVANCKTLRRIWPGLSGPWDGVHSRASARRLDGGLSVFGWEGGVLVESSEVEVVDCRSRKRESRVEHFGRPRMSRNQDARLTSLPWDGGFLNLRIGRSGPTRPQTQDR